jgi:cell wall-associated NlpC family hydrolase
MTTDGAVTTVTDALSNAWLATYTLNSRTVTMAGEQRTFSENNITITHSTWVRAMTLPFSGTVDTTWLSAGLANNKNNGGTADVLSIASEYLQDGDKNAKYGPTATTEGSDFNDYLQINWTYTPHWSVTQNKQVSSWTDGYDTARVNCLDCSGFIRMVWGYRSGVPMCYNPNPNYPNSSMPRRAFEISANGPGTAVALPATNFRIGDLVFFDADSSTTEEIGRIDHVGMYIGNDQNGNLRFIHSRKSENRGPTFSLDTYGKSILNNDGTGQYLYYVNALKGGRRL